LLPFLFPLPKDQALLSPIFSLIPLSLPALQDMVSTRIDEVIASSIDKLGCNKYNFGGNE
jgi:hypothetical protein